MKSMNQLKQLQNCFTPLSYMNTSAYSTNDQFSSAKAFKVIPKPDFSSIEKKEMTLEFKDPRSYKKPKMLFPQTPIKSHKKTFNTTSAYLGRELFAFHSVHPAHSTACRKLNFNASNSFDEDSAQLEGKGEEKHSTLAFGLSGLTPHFLDCLEEKDGFGALETQPLTCNLNNSIQNDSRMIDMTQQSQNELGVDAFERSGKFECEYFIMKILSEKGGKKVYKCMSKHQKKACIIRKEKMLSNRQRENQIKAFLQQSMMPSASPLRRFCIQYADCWEERSLRSNESFSLYKDSPNQSKVLFSSAPYYHNGDLLDFLTKLQTENFKLSSQFYWDMIFEMMCGLLFLHQCGFVHFDIQPSNFYVNSNGDITLGGLSHMHQQHKIIDLFLNQKTNVLSLEDLFERDSVYVAPELFNRSSPSEIGFECDVFSLGLSLLEIIAKINLPPNGALWREIRTESFELNPSFFSDWNEHYAPFATLIQRMISVDVKRRPSLMDLLTDEVNHPELHKRYLLLIGNAYVKSDSYQMRHLLWIENKAESSMMDVDREGNSAIMPAKRSDSTMGFDFLN